MFHSGIWCDKGNIISDSFEQGFNSAIFLIFHKVSRKTLRDGRRMAGFGSRSDAPKRSRSGSKTSKAKANEMAKPAPRIVEKNFPALTAFLSNWNPKDSTASRSLLTSEIIIKLEQFDHKCIRACIPAIIVDDNYPVDIMHYQEEKGLDDFMARMSWMHKEFASAIGILVGVPDESTAAKIEEAYQNFFNKEENCIVILL